MTTVAPDRWPIQHCASDSCRARIVWARTDRGRRMPVDADPTDAGTILLVDEHNTEPRARVIAQPDRADHAGQLHTSHFATCPAARQFRSPR